MKAFDLKKAIAGEPVLTRDNQKGYVKFTIENDLNKIERLVGIVHNGSLVEVEKWFLNGNVLSDDIAPNDIVGMWEEPRPTVTLTLPCPLKEPRDEMWFISSRFTIIKSAGDGGSKEFLEEGRYFASEYDAQEWLNAMRNSRR
ncbi:pyruvate kinase [Mannheimia sp. HC-2023]|uniref:pyruvate kinase n=1 Tax=Mannheimia indoligenes TaxID=3103145 RepID=UPI002FE627C9